MAEVTAKMPRLPAVPCRHSHLLYVLALNASLFWRTTDSTRPREGAVKPNAVRESRTRHVLRMPSACS